MKRINNNEPPPLSWEIGAPFYIPLRPGGRSHRSLSLIRKSLTTAGWEDITFYCDVDGATERKLPAKRSPQAGPRIVVGASLNSRFSGPIEQLFLAASGADRSAGSP
jgi:hypothetical protein